ncbi:F-box domain [Arabidopsis suecica]|uniref:F-box domain n=1 Tax=Arabidopsis suecica TaxID=45249 RepID=A0A8T2FLP9_ARASU|nr:F-box domain [Arabidopsis suecica]
MDHEDVTRRAVEKKNKLASSLIHAPFAICGLCWAFVYQKLIYKQTYTDTHARNYKVPARFQLPDPLLTQILNHLPTEEAVKTSVLSTRWRTLWLWVHNLELSFSKFSSFNAFLSFGNWFFDSDRVSCIESLKLSLDGNDASYLKPWIDAFVKRKIQRLHVRLTQGCEMPLSLYAQHITTSNVGREKRGSARLKNTINTDMRMYLKSAEKSNRNFSFRLVSSCPVLEELKIDVVWMDGRVYRVHSRSLKSFILTDLESDAKFDISLRFHKWVFNEAKTSTIHMFLAWISRVRDMTICAQTFKLIHHYSESVQLPQFDYMSSLYITLNASDLKWFPIFLRSIPNLKSLILVMERTGSSHQLSPKAIKRVSISSVPECLLSSLEFVEFKAPICGLAPEMMLVWYFLENSPTLKKLTLRLKSHSTKDDFVKKLLKIPRCSTECEVIFL